ncbi:MAG: hypothetical protein EPN97_07470 [Alphaproteobacteria bacterium]|nr:MAG: hypothetical protein EPN97_07470 [Alphaproteobacteria bacterium]
MSSALVRLFRQMLLAKSDVNALLASILILVACIWSPPAQANEKGTPIVNWHPDKYLKGIDTVLVFDRFGPFADDILDINHNQTRPWIQQALTDVFAAEPWISVKGHLTVTEAERIQPNLINLVILVSARKEIIDNKLVKLAALSVQFQQSNYYYISSTSDSRVDFSPEPVTYPFVVPDTKEELEQNFIEGVRYLTSHVPTAFYCANKAKAGDRRCDQLLGYVEKSSTP